MIKIYTQREATERNLLYANDGYGWDYPIADLDSIMDTNEGAEQALVYVPAKNNTMGEDRLVEIENN